ncbi:MAG: Slp family lipoprotein [Deltaproteobacteria bacterium]|nr:Slp family lipoprotein [Deltaproteobacteria bacterium]
MKTKRVFIILTVFLFSACAPFSDGIMQQVDTTAPFAEVQKSPEQYMSRTVLWGGVIIETNNRKGETNIKVMQTSLDMEKRPVNLDKSEGRFIIRYTGFLDPVIYEKGREITVAGDIVGKEMHPLGDITYEYPVVGAKAIRLWEKRTEYRDVYDPFRHHYPLWWYRSPYW